MPPVIRLAEEGDAEGVRSIYAPVVRETAISFELEPPSREVSEVAALAEWRSALAGGLARLR